MATKLLIFDADATLRRCTVPEQGCPNGNGEWEVIPWAKEALAKVDWTSTRFGIASNQAGIAKGYLSKLTAWRMLLECANEVLPPNAYGDVEHRAIRYCPHDPEQNCQCRKPAPAMLLTIMENYGIGPNETTFVGDLDTDRLAAEAAKVQFQWVWDFCGKTKHEWTTWLLKRVLANLGPAWVPVNDGSGDLLVMRFDRGSCPRCEGMLRPRMSPCGTALFAEQCDKCSGTWWFQVPHEVPTRYLPPAKVSTS